MRPDEKSPVNKIVYGKKVYYAIAIPLLIAGVNIYFVLQYPCLLQG